MSTALMALNPEWLATDLTQTVTSNITTGTTSSTVLIADSCYRPWPTPDWYYPPWIYPITVSSPSRPIKLTLREVERLREAAHRDRELRAILEKFTPQIEVSVSFEER